MHCSLDLNWRPAPLTPAHAAEVLYGLIRLRKKLFHSHPTPSSPPPFDPVVKAQSVWGKGSWEEGIADADCPPARGYVYVNYVCFTPSFKEESFGDRVEFV